MENEINNAIPHIEGNKREIDCLFNKLLEIEYKNSPIKLQKMKDWFKEINEFSLRKIINEEDIFINFREIREFFKKQNLKLKELEELEEL